MPGLVVRSAVLGFACGLRSSLGPAAVAAGSSAPYALAVTGVAVLGELIGDKLPRTPSRLAPAPFTARLVSGAGSAAVLARRDRPSSWPRVRRSKAGWTVSKKYTDNRTIALAAVIGATGAAVGSLAGERWRAAAAGPLHGDLPGALIEDVTAVAVAGYASGLVGPKH